MRRRSLKRFLLGGVLIANLACSILFGSVAIVHELHGRRRAFDVTLRGRADSLLASSGHLNSRSLPAVQSDDWFQILSATGVVVWRSRNGLPHVQELDGLPSGNGYFDLKWNGRPYRGLRLQKVAAGPEDEPSLTVVYAVSTEDLHHEAVEAAIYYFEVALCLLLVITAVLVCFLRSALAPLSELAARAGGVSTESWQFEVPADALDIQELRPIAKSIHDLLQRLKMAFDMEKRFTGDAAHELKTPISIMKTRLQLLSMRQRRVEEYEVGMSELAMDLHRMEDLTTAMLTLASVESNAADPLQSVELNAIAQSMVRQLRPIAIVKEVKVCVCTEEHSFVRMRSMDAEILCSNLMMNALQHSPAGSMMMVSVVAREEAIEFCVTDCGEGIPAESLGHIFDRFFRVDSSRSRQTGGVGLGLAICKAVADRSRATIRVSSEVGRGTEVLVTFPQQGA